MDDADRLRGHDNASARETVDKLGQRRVRWVGCAGRRGEGEKGNGGKWVRGHRKKKTREYGKVWGKAETKQE
jgi:hypothetical protein